jgi:plastocyanin
MRIHILPGLLAIIWAQTIFYQEDFNNGVPNDWSLNTSDQGSTTTLLYNRWVVGADYNGNDVDNPISSVPANPSYCCPTNCGGFCAFTGCAAGQCIPADIPDIPDQPAAITGGPQSAFLHVSYNPAYDNACPPATTTFSYMAPTQFFPCYPAANLFAKKSQPVAIPATATNIKLSFFWLAGGGTNAYGEVYYSTNGTNWTRLTSRSGSQQLRNNANSWYADTISLPGSVAGQNLYIGFRFVSQMGGGHADPPIGVDEIRVFGDLPGSGPTIDITNIPPVPTVCAGNSVSIAFSTTGSFNTGNQFTAQLSDAAGSFAAPLATATGAASPISLTIPATTPTGTYRIRVVSSNPAVVSDTVDVDVVNLTNLTCTASPTNPTTGQAVTFTLNGSGLPTGSFNVSLDIDNNGTPDYTQNGVNLPHSFTHTYTTAGSYTAVFTLTHPSSGCTGTCQVPVNVGTPPPTIDITSIPPVPTVCAGNSVSIAFSTTGSFNTGNQFTAQLSDAAGSFAAPLATATGAASPISLTIPATTPTGTYRIRVVSSNPAVVSDTVDVNVVNLSNLTCSANPPNPTAGQAVTFTLNGAGLPTGPFNISLDIDNNGTPDYTQNGVTLPHSFTHTYTAAGSYTAVFTLTHPGSGCTGTCQVPVNVGTPPPTIDITSIPPVPTVCAGNSVSIAFSTTGSFNAGNQFTAQLSDAAGSFAAPLATATGAASPISLTIPATTPTGTYRIRVVSSNPAVVSDTVDVNVVNLSNLTCSANPPNPTAGQAVTFTLNGSGLPTGTFNISLDIDNNGTPDYTQNGVTLPHSFTHTYTTAGSYTAVFTLTHPGSGCTGTCQVTVNVGAAPTLTLNSVQPSSVCAGGTINIQFSASGSYGAGNTFTAQLSDLSGSFANPTILGSGTSSPISAVIPITLNSGTYQVRVVSSNPVVISNTQTLTITNIQSLRCSATPNPANAGQAVQIQLTGTGLPTGTLNVSFNPGDGSSPQTNTVSSLPATFTHTYANPGSYTAVFTVSEPISQCVGTCRVPITVQAANNLSQAAGLNIRLYPNPSRGGAFLEGVPVGWEVRVVTPLGQVLYRERSDGRTLHLPSLPQGFYLVEVGAVGSLRWVVLE